MNDRTLSVHDPQRDSFAARKSSVSSKGKVRPASAAGLLETAERFDLRTALLLNTPLQKLYEKVYFQDYNLATAAKK